MAKLEDYNLRIINHGSWSDPEVKWYKSPYQTLLFNYWDCAECFEDENYDFSNDDDLEIFADWISQLTPSEYDCPDIYYEWRVDAKGSYDFYDDGDYYKEYKLSPKEDFVLHNSCQALRQALSYLDDCSIRNANIEIFRHDYFGRELVAEYSLQGSTLKDLMDYAA